MVEIKVIRNTYGGEEYLRKACAYSMKKEAVTMDGIGVNPYNIDDAFMQMMAVKKYYRKTGGNPLIHIVVSFDSCVTDIFQATDMSKEIAEYYGGRYQILWFVHHKERDSSFYHVHLVINSVSYVDGKMFDSGIVKMNEFREYIKELTGRYVFLLFENKAK